MPRNEFSDTAAACFYLSTAVLPATGMCMTASNHACRWCDTAADVLATKHQKKTKTKDWLQQNIKEKINLCLTIGFCRQYSKEYVGDEERAKVRKAGIWAGDFQLPWEYRKEKKAGGKASKPAALPVGEQQNLSQKLLFSTATFNASFLGHAISSKE